MVQPAEPFEVYYFIFSFTQKAISFFFKLWRHFVKKFFPDVTNCCCGLLRKQSYGLIFSFSLSFFLGAPSYFLSLSLSLSLSLLVCCLSVFLSLLLDHKLHRLTRPWSPIWLRHEKISCVHQRCDTGLAKEISKNVLR